MRLRERKGRRERKVEHGRKEREREEGKAGGIRKE